MLEDEEIDTMDTVKKWNDILKNIDTLEKYSKSIDNEIKFHTSLVKKGTCFIAYQQNDRIHFAPSRFVGYSNNEMNIHTINESKDGGLTNPAISKILGDSPQINSGLEYEYKKYCQSLGFIPNKTGSFGVARKFWFSNNPKELLKKIKHSSTEDQGLILDLQEISNRPNIDKTEKERLISARIGQGWYREGLLKCWKKCAITQCDEISLLRASHIKPWCYSSDKERLDINNGLLLSANFDLLFDKGFITFDENGSIQTSEKLSVENSRILGIEKNMKIKLNDKQQSYIEWHRKNIFIKY
jgi:hypothetical protein